MNKFSVLLAQKEMKEGKRFNQVDIAKSTGLSPATISRWMKGKNVEDSTIKTARLLCDWLECDLADLVYLERDNSN